jgi:hypothetical protein
MTYLIFILSLLITAIFHEAGHLLASLFCKVKVEAFCIGFFKPYLHKKWKGIDWRITPFLLGGYCQIAGETENIKDGLLCQPYYKKVIIILAGVFVNLCIALICYWINYKNIFLGMYIDWVALKSIFINNYDELINLVIFFEPNLFLMQLSLINLTCFALNLFLPWPCTDGSMLILYGMQNVWKEKFVSRLQFLVTWGFISINVLQGILILWMWLK